MAGTQKKGERGVKVKLERKVGSLISMGDVLWRTSSGPKYAANLLPETTHSPGTFAGWNIVSELAEAGDFAEMACQVFLYSSPHRVRESTLGEGLA